MDLLKNIADGISYARDSMAERSRKSAIVNRLRNVIRCEEKNCDREFIALGRYYYNSLRDPLDSQAEMHCVNIDESEKKIEGAAAHLEKLIKGEDKDETVHIAYVNTTKDSSAAEDPDDKNAADEAKEGAKPEAVSSSGSELAEDGENDNLPFE